ncbi:hypothetical protein C0Z18_32150 [Trinickia dabaoshanensis]|uniref:Uncharacterized protein n=1 Tax=Trinickia dabaoshanensis TaxID=564714 RepID=A0A2N7VAY8_9BURK|nr:DUF6339 family protein [Trinickia dabaoshanensis]PMS14332.1 hypothetical protein C0Z18_32150 [Trinickia dabaoshanensis]
MRYPILTTMDASAYLASKRAGNPLDLDRLVKNRGDGEELDQAFINVLVADLANLRAKYPANGMKSQKNANRFEGDAARIIHEHIQLPPEIVADADFWLWLAIVHFSDMVEWRYGNPEHGTGLANYGVGARSENLIYRLWLRADLLLDDEADDRYHLCQRGQIDFYRSHLFRQGYANARSFARALIRFQYPNSDTTAPHLKVDQIRELVKRLRRLRANLFLEILDETECRKIIEDEAGRMPA